MYNLNLEDLKCCGNCVHRSCKKINEVMEEVCLKKNTEGSWAYCTLWEFDQFDRDYRLTK